MKNNKVADTLDDIKSLMENSTRIMSLNGTAAIFIGIYACVAAAVAYFLFGSDGQFVSSLSVNMPWKYRMLLLIAAILILLSVVTVLVLSSARARKMGQRLKFNRVGRRILWSFSMPLLIGGFLCLAFFSQGLWGMTSSLMLVFYGISLVNASHYTHSDSRYLGYAQIALGLVDSMVAGYALYFWVIGFGVFHIIYGIYFFIKNK